MYPTAVTEPPSPSPPPLHCSHPDISAYMLKFLHSHLFRRLLRRHNPSSQPKITVRKLAKTRSPSSSISAGAISSSPAAIHPNSPSPGKQVIRVATFNASLFSMAPAVPSTKSAVTRTKSSTPRSILKQSPLHPSSEKSEKFAKSRLRVSINLPDNEISLGRSRRMTEIDEECVAGKGKSVFRSTESFSGNYGGGDRTVLDVLRELNVDILALQEVKADEEKEMKPLSDLAAALGMNYAFAESWAPEYGNAVLSRWPIKRWRVQKIFDDSDFRNVLKTTIDVPQVGEVNFYSTHLDHLNEDWRMKQINSIIQSNDAPHILVGGLNSLDETDYSQERWTDIVKYYEDMGKPTPKAEVLRFLKNKQYTDAKDFAGECESVVVIAKGQSVQGTCKYGTRVDYILASPSSPYKFVPGSYSVYSSKGTSDHHIVKVDIEKVECIHDIVTKKKQQQQMKDKKRVVKITDSSPKGIWKIDTTNKPQRTGNIYYNLGFDCLYKPIKVI
ncbi:uncharacterized protein [Phyllobates terribilis]|uniref:uncharacterized protein n=1 Tax=Phyllobates terribilis TaxID=111132 RepID=UPI003CCAC55F